MDTWSKQTQFKPNSNLVLSAVEWANFQKAKMNANLYVIEFYRKKDDFAVRKNKPNSKPISSKAKMNANAFSQKDYENETALRPQKNKPNSNPNKACPELAEALSAAEGAVEWANFTRKVPLHKQ